MVKEKREFVIQKLILGKDLTWLDVKGCESLEEGILSLRNFYVNNPEYAYRLVEVYITTRIN